MGFPYTFNEMYRSLTTSSRASFAQANGVFKELVSKWWDLDGILVPLHSMNAVRIPLIRDGLLNTYKRTPERSSQPLKGFKILDIGCGGGILSEPLARLGAEVTGVDPVPEGVEAARAHADADESVRHNVTYICGTTDDIPREQTFDAVVASEVIEHVNDPAQLVEAAVNLTKENGSLFFTTMNRTWQSYILGIVAAENIFHVIPKGAHDWNMFIPPNDLQFLLESKGCEIRLVHGMCYNPLTRKFSWQRDTSISYAVHAIKRH